LTLNEEKPLEIMTNEIETVINSNENRNTYRIGNFGKDPNGMGRN
jgi:hypothetical protein